MTDAIEQTAAPVLTAAEEIAAMVAADDEWRHAERAKMAAALRWMRDRGRVRTRETEAGMRGWVYQWRGTDSIALVVMTYGDLTIYAGSQVLTPESVTQAVDLLAALGVLPVQMSSQFQAGTAAAGWSHEAEEWSCRMHNGRSAFACTFTEGGARRYAADNPAQLAVFRRAVGPWVRQR